MEEGSRLLVLERKEDQTIVIDTSDGVIRVTVQAIKGRNKVRLAIHAPRQCDIWREELIDGEDTGPDTA